MPFSSMIVTIMRKINLKIRSGFLIASVWLPLCFSTNIFWYPERDLPQFVCKKPLLSISCEVKWLSGWSLPFKVLSALCYWLEGLAEWLSSALWSEIDCDQTHSNQLWHTVTQYRALCQEQSDLSSWELHSGVSKSLGFHGEQLFS